MDYILGIARKILNYASIKLEPVQAKETHQESIVAYWLLFLLTAITIAFVAYNALIQYFDVSTSTYDAQLQAMMALADIPLIVFATAMMFLVVFQFIIGRKVECPHCEGRISPRQGWVCPQHHHENHLRGKGLYWVFYHKCFHCRDDIISFQCPFCRKYIGLTAEARKWDQRRLRINAARPFMVRETRQDVMARLQESNQIAEIRNKGNQIRNRRRSSGRNGQNASHTQSNRKKENRWTSSLREYEDAEKALESERKKKMEEIDRKAISDEEKQKQKDNWNKIIDDKMEAIHNDILGF